MNKTNNYKVATLVYLENDQGEQLLLHRKQSPNKGRWSPIGGKLDTSSGESPVDCAIREAFEEVNIQITAQDLHHFGYLAEESYEGQTHWLIFLFHCKKKVNKLPKPISEGEFGFHSHSEIQRLPIPPTDAKFVWPIYQNNRSGFTGLKIKYTADGQDFIGSIETQITIPNQQK